MEEKSYTKGVFYLLLTFTLIVLMGILKITASITIPIALAVFLALCMLPILNRLHKKIHLNWGLGIFLSLVIFVILITVIVSLLTKSTQSILTAFPKYEDRMLYVYQYIAETFDFPYDEGKSLIQNLWSQLGVRSAVQNFAFTVSNYAVSFIKDLITILLLYSFLLAEVNLFQGKVNNAFEGKI